MISKLSAKLTEKLSDKEFITNEDRDLYEYAFFLIGSYAFFFVVSLVMGFFVKIPIEAIAFFLSFCLIRNFAGGIHADSETKCVIFSTFSIVISVIVIKTFILFELLFASIAIMFLSFIIIVTLSPVDTENKRLNKQERTIYRKKTMVLTILILIGFICAIVLNLHNIAFSLSMGTTLASVLLILGKIKQNQKTAR